MQRIKLRGTIVSRQIARHGLSQSSLADRLDISAGYMSQLLAGKRCPGPTLRTRMQTTEPLALLAFEDLFEFIDPKL